jgi:hypothetical protein
MRVTTCKHCGALVTWALTKNGKWMPLDYDENEDGSVLLDEYGHAHVFRDAGVARVELTIDDAGVDWLGQYMPHFPTTTCVQVRELVA